MSATVTTMYECDVCREPVDEKAVLVAHIPLIRGDEWSLGYVDNRLQRRQETVHFCSWPCLEQHVHTRCAERVPGS